MMKSNKISPLPVYARIPLCSIGKIAVASLLATMLSAGAALAAPGGELDATFGENGRLTIKEARLDGHAIYQQARSAILQQPDGKLLVAGQATSSTNGFDFAVLRINPDGSLDESFGTNGRVMIDFAGFDDFATELALQADGKIIAAGTSTSATGSDFAFARLDTDGSIDATLDGDGLVTLDLGGGYEQVRGILLLEDGQLVITGRTYANDNMDMAFARFDTDGALDPTFGTGPIAGTTLIDASDANGEGFQNDEPFWITRQVDGKYVACGVADTDYWDYAGNMVAVRVNPDGSIDTGFGINGVSRIETDGWANACISMPDGTIMLAGVQGRGLVVARLTSDGSKDTTFGNSGSSRIDIGDAEWVQAMAPLNDGRLGVTGGVVGTRGISTDMYFARVDPNSGLLDESFGNNGVTIIDFGMEDKSAWSEGLTLIQQTDGKLVAAGITTGGSIALARVDPAGTGNTGFAGFVETSANVTEGTAELVLSVRRTGGSTGQLSVDYDTVAGTATTPGDFTPSFGTLHWTSGDMDAKSIRVPITDDNIAEGNENFTIVLSNSSGGLAASEFLVTITEKGPPSPSSGGGPQPRPPSGGGGGLCLDLLMLLAMRKWQRRLGAPPPSPSGSSGGSIELPPTFELKD